MNAFLYLSWTSARNRFWFQVRRVRSPRYAAALAVGAFYVWAFLFRPASNGAGAGSLLLGRPTETIVTLLAVLTLMGTWLFGSDSTALAFTPAELSILFPAPLSRRALIGYKLYRVQVAMVINAMIWVFVLRRGGTALPSPLRAIGIWMLFSTLNLHRIGAALVRASAGEHGRAGVKRNVWSILAFVAVGAALAVGLWQNRADFGASNGVGAFFAALGRALSNGPAAIALWPFHLVVAPTFAHTIGEWRQAIVPALVMLAVHVWWVLRSDAAFEDAAIEASAHRARRLEAMRSRRSLSALAPPRAAGATMRLAAAGHPAGAILWKNLLCLRRTAQWRVFLGPLAMAIALGFALSNGGHDAGAFVAMTALMLGAMLIVFGGRLIRNDLRHDMLNLPLIKTLPVPPGDIVLAEVASSALPMAALQLVLLVIAYAGSLFSESAPLSAEARAGLVLASPAAILAVNGALLTIQNAAAVLFPAWIRLGATVNTGVEALGQNVLATAANLVSLVIALIVPVILAYLTLALAGERSAATVGVAIVVASVALAAETYAGMRLLGNALAKAEPTT